MRLQADQTVDDLDAGLLEPPRPCDVFELVETRLHLHDGRYLFAFVGRIGKGLDDRRSGIGAIKRLFDRFDIGIVGRGLDELHD